MTPLASSSHVPTPPRSATAGELARAGIDSTMLRRQRDAGSLTRVSRGIYLKAEPGLDGQTDAGHREHDGFDARRADHLRRAVACVNALKGSYLVAETACLAHGLPVWQVPARVQLSREPRLQSSRAEVDARRPWWPLPAEVAGWGVLAQPPSAAMMETASRLGTLAGLVSADAAAHRGVTWDAAALLDVWGSRPGAARVRQLLTLVDGRHESPLESWVAWEAHVAGIFLEPQVVVRDDFGGWLATVDFVVEGTNVIVEADGIGKYTGHRAFKDERVRQNQIEELGWIVVRVTWEDLRASRFLPRLRAAMARATSRPLVG